MPYPLHPPSAVRTQRVISEVELTDEVTLHEVVSQRAGHGAEYEDAPTVHSGPFPGLLANPTPQLLEQAQAQGIAVRWVLLLPSDITVTPARPESPATTVRPGLTATVTRATDQEEWTREVEITGVDVSGGVHLTCTAVDLLLNQ